jgi:aspartate/methionine/tyrosine aminotransferase
MYYIQKENEVIMNPLLDEIRVSGIVQIRDRLLKLENPLRLESGEPSFDTPLHIKEAAIEALRRNETHYVNSQGILPLRETLSKKLFTTNNIEANSDDILITNGGMHGLYSIFSSIVSTGDEVIIPTPNWTCVQWLITMTGAKPVHVPLRKEKEFRFDYTELEASITSKTKAILINSPHNPTGAVFEKEDLLQIIKVAEKYNLIIVSDEAYEHIHYDNHEHISPLSLVKGNKDMEEKIITVFTFSKSYAMTGWRLGYVVSKSKKIISAMKKIVLYSANGVNSITQWAGIAAIEGDQSFLTTMQTQFKKNRDLLTYGIEQSRFLNLEFKPKGAFYCFPKISEEWEGYLGQKTDEAFASYLIDNGKLGCTPGSTFGPGGDGYMRFSYACSYEMLEKAVEQLIKLA